MRICLFTPVFLPAVGGAEVVTSALARQFTAKGHHTVVLARGRPAQLDEPYPVEWFPEPILPRWRPERVGKALLRAHKRHHFDIVACNYAQPTGYAALRAQSTHRLPVVVISHGGDLYHSAKHRRLPHLWRRTVETYLGADGLITISPYIETLIREINPSPPMLELIPNGVDVLEMRQPADRPSDFTDDRPFALCLGNLNPMKGFDDAVAAFGIAHERIEDLALVIVGKGPSEPRLRQLVQMFHLDGRIHFVGQRTGSDKRWFMQNCRFGLMPSIEEGHPIVGLEFLAAGRPVICSTNAAFDGMYDHGINALRVAPNDPEALAQALIQIQQANLPDMGAESAKRAERYEWSAAADHYLKFFDQVRASYGASSNA